VPANPSSLRRSSRGATIAVIIPIAVVTIVAAKARDPI
jgi:hypothetical protein